MSPDYIQRELVAAVLTILTAYLLVNLPDYGLLVGMMFEGSRNVDESMITVEPVPAEK